VRPLLDSCDICGPAGVRDYAKPVLIARLGLRSIKAARLRLDDLDWRAAWIVLRAKASREDGMPLPADVGEALHRHHQRSRRGLQPVGQTGQTRRLRVPQPTQLGPTDTIPLYPQTAGRNPDLISAHSPCFAR
jgi:integrase